MIKFTLFSCNKIIYQRIITYKLLSIIVIIYVTTYHKYFFTHTNINSNMNDLSCLIYKKPPLYGVVFIKSEKFYVVLLITFLYLPYIIVLPIFPPLFLSPYYFISPTYSSLPLTCYLVRSLQAINSSATTCGFWLSLMRASILRT